MRPRCGGLLAGWLTSRANSSALQLRAVYPVNVKALAVRAATSHAIVSCCIHATCDQVTGRDWCAYTHPERRTRHMSAPQVRTPLLDAGSVGVPDSGSGTNPRGQLPPDSQTPSMSTPGEKRQNQCLDRRPIRTTTDGHVVQTTKPTFHRWVAHAPSPGRMSNPGPNWATTWSPSHAHTQHD